VLAEIFQGNTRVTGRWDHGAFEATVPAMREHVISATYVGMGKAASKIDGRITEVEVRPGTITYLPRGFEGDYRCTANTTSNIYLGHDRLQGCADHLAEGRSFELIDRIHFRDERTFAIMRMIADEADSPGLHSRIFLEQAVDLLCIQLLRTHSSLSRPLVNRQHGLAPWQVKRVTQYMREHLGQDISLQELANILGMSRFHFCTAFRKATGATPHAQLTRMRMEMACSLMRTTPLLIGDVALAVGYGSVASFSTAFHRFTGLSPRDYRNLRRN
jgi:AraC-like DNA-binding protein